MNFSLTEEQTMLRDTAKMTPYKPSMLLDWERRAPLELDAIYGRPLAAAAAAGVDCPAITALHAELRERDPGRSGSAP